LSFHVKTYTQTCISETCSSVPVIILVPVMLLADEVVTRDGVMSFHDKLLWKVVNLRGTIPFRHQQHVSRNTWVGI